MSKIEILQQQVITMQHDIRHFYFLMGVLTDCIGKLPVPDKEIILEILKTKSTKVDKEYKATLQTIIDVLK